SNAAEPRNIQGSFAGGQYGVVQTTESLRDYAAVDPANLPSPERVGPVANQNLHAASAIDYLIISHAPFIDQALRLAQFHQQRSGMRVRVVSIEQVYNEFAGGSPDPVAIRDF